MGARAGDTPRRDQERADQHRGRKAARARETAVQPGHSTGCRAPSRHLRAPPARGRACRRHPFRFPRAAPPPILRSRPRRDPASGASRSSRRRAAPGTRRSPRCRAGSGRSTRRTPCSSRRARRRGQRRDAVPATGGSEDPDGRRPRARPSRREVATRRHPVGRASRRATSRPTPRPAPRSLRPRRGGLP